MNVALDTVPLIFATATLMTALVTSAPVLTIKVPSGDVTFTGKMTVDSKHRLKTNLAREIYNVTNKTEPVVSC